MPIRGKVKKNTFIIGGIFIFLCIMVFIWPTKYRYERVTQGNNTHLVRINRLSGLTQFFDVSLGWITPEPEDWVISEPRAPLSADKIARITGTVWVGFDRLQFYLYNGNDFTVGEIVFSITKYGPTNNILWEREYKVEGTMSPLKERTYEIRIVGLIPSDKLKLKWAIKSATGL